MRISRTRAYRVDMPNYERTDFSVSATVDHLDLGYTDDEWSRVMGGPEDEADKAVSDLERYCLKLLDRQMEKELAEAKRLCSERSFLYKPSRPSRRDKNR